MVGVGGYLAYPWVYPKFVAWQAARTAKPEKVKQRIVPVIAIAARSADMDIYLSGLGTVTAFNSVTVRSRVDGELVKVAFNEGEMIREGQLLAKIDPRQYQVQLAQAKGNLARDRAILKNAELDLDRYTGLAKTKSVSAQQVDLQQAIVEQNEGVVQSDLAMIESAKLQLSYCQITAPISGRIGLRSVDQGNMVRASDPGGLAVITQLEPISVVFTIPQDDIGIVQRQSHSDQPLQVEAFDRDFKTLLATGTLQALDNQVDPTTGTLKLKAVFQNERNTLFPNQFVNARLLVDRLKDATIIPAAAVQRGPTSTFVYVVNADSKPEPTVELRNVVLGPTEGDQTAIKKGLSVGEQVVTDGIDKLQPKAQVSLRTDKNPAGADAPKAIVAKPDASLQESPAPSHKLIGHDDNSVEQSSDASATNQESTAQHGSHDDGVRKASAKQDDDSDTLLEPADHVDRPSPDEAPRANSPRTKPTRSRTQPESPRASESEGDTDEISHTPARAARHKAPQ